MLFDARKAIREKLQEGVDPQPAKLADTLATECPEEYLRLALSQALPYLVRDEIRKVRHAALGRRGTQDGKPARGQDTWEEVASADPDDPAEQPSEGRAGARRHSRLLDLPGAGLPRPRPLEIPRGVQP